MTSTNFECDRCGVLVANHDWNVCPEGPSMIPDTGEVLTFEPTRTLEDIDAKLNYLLGRIERIDKTINNLIPEIRPIVDQLANSPMFRMLTGAKKK